MQLLKAGLQFVFNLITMKIPFDNFSFSILDAIVVGAILGLVVWFVRRLFE